MTTGGVAVSDVRSDGGGGGEVEGTVGECGGREKVVGHSKMAAAVSHLLSSPPQSERRRKRAVRENRHLMKKRMKQERDKVDETVSDSECEGNSPVEDDVSVSVDVVASCQRLPDALTLDHERRLQTIATTGVVQLFNAVSKYSKDVQSKVKAVGQSERKKAKVLSTIDKGSFIDLLKGHRVQSKWPALKQDYMLGARMRDWGEGEGGEVEGEERDHDNSSSDSNH